MKNIVSEPLLDVASDCRAALPQEVVAFIEECLKKPHSESFLIAILRKTQDLVGYLSQPAMFAIGQLMQIPTSKVYGVASFYNYFRLEQRGIFLISMCKGTACYVKGSEQLIKKFEEELGIKSGETTKDGVFTLEITRCLGTCALAPVIKINDDVFPQVTPDQVPHLIEQCMAKVKDLT